MGPIGSIAQDASGLHVSICRGNRMVLMHDAPLSVLLSEPHSQPKVEFHTLPAAGVTAPADRGRERHVRPRGDRNVAKLEHHRLGLPSEESLPRGHVLLDPPRYE